MTTPDITRLRALYEAATGGEWELDTGLEISGADGAQIATTFADAVVFRTPDECEANATFITAAKNAFPALLAAAEKLARYEAQIGLSETDYTRMETAVNVERAEHILTRQKLRLVVDELVRLRRALRSAVDDFELVQERIADSQHERAKATAFQGAKEATAALAALARVVGE